MSPKIFHAKAENASRAVCTGLWCLHMSEKVKHCPGCQLSPSNNDDLKSKIALFRESVPHANNMSSNLYSIVEKLRSVF